MQKTKREQLNEFINEIAWLEAKLVNQKLQKNLKGHVAGSKSKEEHAKSDLGPEQECESGLPGARKIFKKKKGGKKLKKLKRKTSSTSQETLRLSVTSQKVLSLEQRRSQTAQKNSWKIRRSKSTVERLMEFKERGGKPATQPFVMPAASEKVQKKKSPEEQSLAMELLSMPTYLRSQHFERNVDINDIDANEDVDIFRDDPEKVRIGAESKKSPRKIRSLEKKDLSQSAKDLIEINALLSHLEKDGQRPATSDGKVSCRLAEKNVHPGLNDDYFDSVLKLSEIAGGYSLAGTDRPKTPNKPISRRLEELSKPVGMINDKKKTSLKYDDVVKRPKEAKEPTGEQLERIVKMSTPKRVAEKYESEYKTIGFGGQGSRFESTSKYNITPGPNAYDLNKSSLHTGGACKISDANPKSELDWIIYRAKQTPGPSDYGAPDLPRKEGVRFSDANVPSELDLCAVRGSRTPGPNAYDLNKSSLHTGGACKISDANPKSELDWIINRAKQTPGPSDYGAPDLPRKEGVRFSNVNLPTEIDMIAKRASAIPGPNAYDLNKSSLHTGGACKISDANPKSELDWIIYRAKQTPGPSDYGTPDLPRKEGVRFSNVNLPTEIDMIAKRASEIPGPGEYSVVDVRPEKGVRFSNVFLPTEIDRIAKVASEIPGPGAYERVDPSKISKRY